MATAAPDYRFIGPVTLCPGCGANAFETIVSLDQDTHEITAYFLNATCGQCDAKVIMACPIDKIVKEPGLNTKEESDDAQDL
jgi:hypothetical protein